jgi:release factor glutamine methyltransferase
LTALVLQQSEYTVATIRRAASRALRERSVETPELDARILVGHALGLDLAGLATDFDRTIANEELAHVSALIARRLAGEPVARITGVKEFWGLSLHVTPDTLVPRPETETVVEAALAHVDAAGLRGQPIRIADLGTGSGALLLALLAECPRATGVATDISIAALETARDNAARLGLAARAEFLACDFAQGIGGKFDVVVCNPPYVRSGDLPYLQCEVREHDPHLALDGGADGLDAYRVLASAAGDLLEDHGIFVLELGIGQERSVRTLLRAAGLAVEPARPDLGGVARALLSKRP